MARGISSTLTHTPLLSTSPGRTQAFDKTIENKRRPHIATLAPRQAKPAFTKSHSRKDENNKTSSTGQDAESSNEKDTPDLPVKSRPIALIFPEGRPLQAHLSNATQDFSTMTIRAARGETAQETKKNTADNDLSNMHNITSRLVSPSNNSAPPTRRPPPDLRERRGATSSRNLRPLQLSQLRDINSKQLSPQSPNFRISPVSPTFTIASTVSTMSSTSSTTRRERNTHTTTATAISQTQYFKELYDWQDHDQQALLQSHMHTRIRQNSDSVHPATPFSNDNNIRSSSFSSKGSQNQPDIGGITIENGIWQSSAYDISSLSEKELRKLSKRGINPALYLEMQAARKGRSKWINPLSGSTFMN